jgi:predicted nucleic acid-binding protein
MTVVIDANVLVAYALDSDRSHEIQRHLTTWSAAGMELHAPSLLPYEVASALARYVGAGHFGHPEAQRVWACIRAIAVTSHPLDDGAAVIGMARRLERTSAYDAAYIVLAQRLGTYLWTLDGRLARNASTRNLPVRLIGGAEPGLRL